MKAITKLLATMFYIGYFPVAPGTMGTLAAFIVYLLLPSSLINSSYLWVIVLLAIYPAVLISSKAEMQLGKDDKKIVIDEFIGYFTAVLFLPKTLVIGVIAFIYFRIFDILKPSPVDELQNLKGGWGVVADDLMAGLYANLCTQIIYYLFLVR